MERWGRTTPIAQRRPRGAALLRDAQGRKQCSVCLTWQELGAYAASPVQADGLQPRCKGCVRFATYHVTPERYAALVEAQGGVCGLCGQRDSSGRDLTVDHDHRCCPVPRSCGRCVRGLLCNRCNVGLGRFQDSPEMLRAAAAYLTFWSAQPPRRVPAEPPKPRGRRWPKFRLTDEEYARTVAAQGGSCAVCRREPGRRSLSVDHDHRCCATTPACGTCVRGLLCTSCNTGLSHFNEDAELIIRTAEYVEAHMIVCT
ncbi:endonuclease VII domain-containing protein [Streptomyces sp. MH60]|uniref:endonuclease VII domain-containing protein n=1 Tax=Streptomyces sp. MH60 TaxID=1940758 RepID=UPI00406D01E2